MATVKVGSSTKHADVGEEKQSGYFIDGKEVILGRRRGRPPVREKRTNPGWYSQDRKVEACTLYAVYGDVTEVHRLTDIPEATIRAWKQEPWWIEIIKQIYIEQNEGLGTRIHNTLDKTLELLADRLENGDAIYDSRRGEVVRKPMDAKVLAILFDNLSVQRRLNRGEPTSISQKIGTEDRLETLKKEFEKFSKSKTIEGEVSAIIEEL